MTNRILKLEVRNHSTIPAEAEVHLTVVPEQIVAGMEVRGRLMGPHCRFASTVEIAYHLRRILVPTARPAVTLRAILPEANLWSPEAPHLYYGPVELLQDGRRTDIQQVSHGLRTFHLGPRGLRINGKIVALTGRNTDSFDESTALQWRQEGVNLLVVPVNDRTREIWTLADSIGFVVLGRLSPEAHQETVRDLSERASCLGWILPPSPPLNLSLPAGALIGAEDDSRADFVIRRADQVAAGVPILLQGQGPAPEGVCVFGRIS